MFFLGMCIGIIVGVVVGSITMMLFCASDIAKEYYKKMFFMDEEIYHELRRIKREQEGTPTSISEKLKDKLP